MNLELNRVGTLPITYEVMNVETQLNVGEVRHSKDGQYWIATIVGDTEPQPARFGMILEAAAFLLGWQMCRKRMMN